jgi:hypothetical protein
MSQRIEHLPSKREANSNPSTAKKKEGRKENYSVVKETFLACSSCLMIRTELCPTKIHMLKF